LSFFSRGLEEKKMISKVEKTELIKQFGKTEQDTGSSSVQAAILTRRINNLMGHFEKHIHDFHSNRGLLKMIGKRKSHLKYLQRTDREEYLKVIKALGLRK
jgi:small subunit ribosomal protein S15